MELAVLQVLQEVREHQVLQEVREHQVLQEHPAQVELQVLQGHQD